MSLERHEIGASTPALSGLNGQDPSDLISVADAADILRLSKRQVQRLAASPGGLGAVRAGRTWMLAKAPVLALAKERARDRTNCLPPELGSARSTPA
jgi:excisionase family DNA binding protein